MGVNTTNSSRGLPEDTPLIEPVSPPETSPDPGDLDTDRILRETGSLSLPATTAAPPDSPPVSAPVSASPTGPAPTNEETPTTPADTAGLDTTTLDTTRASWNVLAIVAFVLGLALSPLAALFGYLALGSLRRLGQHGENLAVAAIVLGWIWTLVFGVVGITVGIIWFQL